MAEFNLSEKRNKRCDAHYPEIDVKEFIKRDWEVLGDFIVGKINMQQLIEKRNKLIGDKLIGADNHSKEKLK